MKRKKKINPFLKKASRFFDVPKPVKKSKVKVKRYKPIYIDSKDPKFKQKLEEAWDIIFKDNLN